MLTLVISFGINDVVGLIETQAATVDEINSSEVFLKQEGSTTCTLCATAMMLRRGALLSGNSNWRSITESSIKSTAWINGSGLRWNFSYAGMTVAHGTLPTGSANESRLKELLNEHPEGIVIYYGPGTKQHAVLLTDYTNGQFYCADPYGGKPSGRIPLSSALYVTVSNVSAYWYISSPDIPGPTGSSCNCSESYRGNYKVTTSSIPLNMRSGHGSSYSVVTTIPKGTTVYVTKANGSWAHVEYNGYSGYCSMEYLTKIDLNIKISCWFSNTGMGDGISEIRYGQDLYLCYKIYDGNSGKLWDELEEKSYSVKQTIYNPDGSKCFSYTYNNDNNWIRITPNQVGTYTGKIELTGDRIGTVSCDVLVRRSFGIETWISDTKMGAEKSSINSGEWIYLCYKIFNQDSGILFNDLEEYNVTYSVKETMYYPDGTEYYTTTYDNSDNNWIRVKANTPGTYKGVITLYLNGHVLDFTEEITVNPQTYQVKYDANGGTGAPSAQTKTQGTALTLSSVKPTKSYTITYDVNGGTLSGTSKKVSCTFVNWNTSSNGSGTSYSAGGSYTKDSAVTLYAQWKNPTAGTLATPTRSGYTFDGWYIKSSGSDNGKKVTSTTTITGNTTLIARWTQNKSTGQISAGKASGSVGEIVAVPIKINKNPGIIALQCKLKYDSAKVQLVDVKGSGILDDSALSTNYAKNPYILSLGDGLNETNITTTGTLATAYFKILPGFTKGTTEIGLTFDVAYDKDVKEVEFTSQNGAIEVKEYIPGDVNRDGYVKLNDAILLRRYVAGWDVTIDLLAADVNRDGQVKLNDAILLRRYVAGWDVTLK